MSTKLFIVLLEKIGIEYNKTKKIWIKDTNNGLSIPRFLIHLNLFKYKSRIHDLLDIIDDSTNYDNIIKMANVLLEHIKLDPEGIENIIDHIKNQRKKQTNEVEFIEYWDVRQINPINILNDLEIVNKVINLQYWDTSNFTSMKNMFSLKDNDKSKKTQSIIFMFDIKKIIKTKKTQKVGSVVDSLENSVLVKGLKYWNTSKVTNMSSMFKNNKLFNEKLEWDTSQVVDMSYMFNNARNFNQSVENWDINKVINMKYMFKNAIKFDQNISWETKLIFDDDIITGSKAQLTFDYYS
jgi:hypothetical protein